MIKLSILINTVPSRIDTFYPIIMKEFLRQIGGRKDVELIGFFDNKKRTVGEKRNAALSLAQGEFLTFIDDDDRVSTDFVPSVMRAIEENPDTDAIVYDCMCVDHGQRRYCKYGIEYEYWMSSDGSQWTGKPAHTMVYRSSIAKSHLYMDKNCGEDIDWVVRACKDIKKQSRINKLLYFYDFNPDSTETRR